MASELSALNRSTLAFELSVAHGEDLGESQIELIEPVSERRARLDEIHRRDALMQNARPKEGTVPT